jgi:hypothetical protein
MRLNRPVTAHSNFGYFRAGVTGGDQFQDFPLGFG